MADRVRIQGRQVVHLVAGELTEDGRTVGRRTYCGAKAFGDNYTLTDDAPTCQRCRASVGRSTWEDHQP